MSSTNPFDPLHEVDREEGLFPGAHSLNNVETNPPRNHELMSMNITSETGDISASTSTDMTQPSNPTEWTTYTTVMGNGPLTHYTGDTTGPSAPPHQNTLYPQIHSRENIVSKEVERVTYSEEYRNQIKRDKEQLNKHFKELQQKLNDHHKKLFEELDSSYERNLPLIKEREEEIALISKTQGKERIKGNAKQALLERKEEVKEQIKVLTDVKVCYKPHLLGNLEEILTVTTYPTNDNPQQQLDDTREAFREDQTFNSPPEPVQSPGRQRRATTPRGAPPSGPITVNVHQGDIQDPAGLVIDKKNSDVIYVADKVKHRVQVFDRSGCSLKTIVHSKIRNPHSLGVSEKFLFTLCAGNSDDPQFLLKFDKIRGTYLGILTLKDMRHIPLSVNEDKIYMATSSEVVEVFNLDMKPCGKIDIKLERKSEEWKTYIFRSGPEVRDICVKMQMLHLLVLNVKHAVQGFSLEGVPQFGLASDQLSDPRYFTVDNRGDVYVTEWKEGKVKRFRRNGKDHVYDSAKVETSEMISKPVGIDVDSKGKIVLCCAQRDWVLKEL